MKSLPNTLIAVLLLCSLAIHAEAQSDHQFVLLKSGKIVEGTYTKEGRQAKISLKQGGYIVLPSEKVEKGFRSRKDIVNYRLAVTPFKTRAQDQLFYWLLDQHAYQVAQEHLAELHRHKDELIGFDFSHWNESIQIHRAKQTLAVEGHPNRDIANTNESKRFFLSKVETHLMVGCAISGCHGSGSPTKYQLEDPFKRELNDQNQTNYSLSIAVINRLGPEEFLKRVSSAHGNLKKPMYSKATSEYLAIATWVNSLKLDSTVVEQNKNKMPEKTIASVPAYPKSNPSSPKAPGSRFEGRLASAQPRPTSGTNPIEPGLIGQAEPRDEFDPLIFNRIQEKKRLAKAPKIKPSGPRTDVAQAPQRLISPDRTNSRK